MAPGAPVTWSVNVPVVVVPSAVTVTENVVLAKASVGVPEMVPVFQFSTSPIGRLGETENTGTTERPLPVPWMVVYSRR